MRVARYRCLTDLAAENVRVGRSVVLVAPFTREAIDDEDIAAAVADSLRVLDRWNLWLATTSDQCHPPPEQ